MIYHIDKKLLLVLTDNCYEGRITQPGGEHE